MITPAQCRAARAWLNMTQEELAHLAGCSLSALINFERERAKTMRLIVEIIQRALEGRGARFTKTFDSESIVVQFSSKREESTK